MYQHCPKCGAQQPQQDGDHNECAHCGVQFAKWLRHQLKDGATVDDRHPVTEVTASSILLGLSEAVLRVDQRVNVVEFWARFATFIGLAVWGDLLHLHRLGA